MSENLSLPVMVKKDSQKSIEEREQKQEEKKRDEELSKDFFKKKISNIISGDVSENDPEDCGAIEKEKVKQICENNIKIGNEEYIKIINDMIKSSEYENKQIEKDKLNKILKNLQNRKENDKIRNKIIELINEIYTTEVTYNKILNDILQHYNTSSYKKKLEKDKDFYKIYDNFINSFIDIKKFSDKILNIFSKFKKDDKEEKILDFTKIKENFDENINDILNNIYVILNDEDFLNAYMKYNYYYEYITNYDLFLNINSDPSNYHKDGKKISDTIITPTQRLPRYELLIKEIIKNAKLYNNKSIKDILEKLEKIQKKVNTTFTDTIKGYILNKQYQKKEEEDMLKKLDDNERIRTKELLKKINDDIEKINKLPEKEKDKKELENYRTNIEKYLNSLGTYKTHILFLLRILKDTNDLNESNITAETTYQYFIELLQLCNDYNIDDKKIFCVNIDEDIKKIKEIIKTNVDFNNEELKEIGTIYINTIKSLSLDKYKNIKKFIKNDEKENLIKYRKYLLDLLNNEKISEEININRYEIILNLIYLFLAITNSILNESKALSPKQEDKSQKISNELKGVSTEKLQKQLLTSKDKLQPTTRRLSLIKEENCFTDENINNIQSFYNILIKFRQDLIKKANEYNTIIDIYSQSINKKTSLQELIEDYIKSNKNLKDYLEDNCEESEINIFEKIINFIKKDF
jgi:hypothetical protein